LTRFRWLNTPWIYLITSILLQTFAVLFLIYLLSQFSGGGFLPTPFSEAYYGRSLTYKGSRILNSLIAFSSSSLYVLGSLLLTFLFAVPLAIFRAKRDSQPLFPEAFSTLPVRLITFICSTPVFVIGYFVAHKDNLPFMPEAKWAYVIVGLAVGNLLFIEVVDSVSTQMSYELRKGYIRAAISRGEKWLWRREYLRPLLGFCSDTISQKIPILYGGIIVLEYSLPITGLNVGGLLQYSYSDRDGWTLFFLSVFFILTMQLLKFASERVSPEKLLEL
jgi:ABC-type dipeptide/oligopeptide/nickel transport system permease component